MKRTKLFDNGRINYSIKYKQYQMKTIDTETGKESMELVHEEQVKYYEFPFTFGMSVQFGLCEDTAAYYRQ
jgi:hypothetical protein